MPILHWIVNYLISAHVDTLILTFLKVYRFKILMYELVDVLMILSRLEERIIKYARRGMLPRGFNFIVWGKLITDYEKLFKLMFFFSFLFKTCQQRRRPYIFQISETLCKWTSIFSRMYLDWRSELTGACTHRTL